MPGLPGHGLGVPLGCAGGMASAEVVWGAPSWAVGWTLSSGVTGVKMVLSRDSWVGTSWGHSNVAGVGWSSLGVSLGLAPGWGCANREAGDRRGTDRVNPRGHHPSTTLVGLLALLARNVCMWAGAWRLPPTHPELVCAPFSCSCLHWQCAQRM